MYRHNRTAVSANTPTVVSVTNHMQTTQLFSTQL